MDPEKFNLKVFVPSWRGTETKIIYAPAGRWTEDGSNFDLEIAPGIRVCVPKERIVQLNYEPKS